MAKLIWVRYKIFCTPVLTYMTSNFNPRQVAHCFYQSFI